MSKEIIECPPRIILLVGGYGKRDAARHHFRQWNNKAQNDLLLVSPVGFGVAPIFARYLVRKAGL